MDQVQDESLYKCPNYFSLSSGSSDSYSAVIRTLAKYFDYYHWSRPHLALGKQCPIPRPVKSTGRIIRIPQLGVFTTVMNASPHENRSGRIFDERQKPLVCVALALDPPTG